MTNRTDNFNRAAASIGTPSDGGSAWSALSGTWNIGSGSTANMGTMASGTSQAACVLESSVANVDVQVTFGDIGSSDDAGIVFRVTDDNNYYVMVAKGSGGDGVSCYKRVAGSFTQVGSTAAGVTFANTNVFKVTANGTSIKAYKNGVEVFSATDSTYTTQTKHGLRSHGFATGFDDFSITEVVTAGSGHTRRMLMGVG